MRLIAKLLRSGHKVFTRNYKTTSLWQHQLSGQNQTLFARIACYIDNEYNKNAKSKSLLPVESSKFKNPPVDFNKDYIKHLTDGELQELLSSLKDSGLLSKPHIISAIDQECVSRLEYLETGRILNILNVLTQLGVKVITKCRFYDAGINNLIENAQFLNQQELLQTMFYVGLKSKSKDVQGRLKKCIKELYKYDINKLSIEELCIICNSTFKTSTKITSKRILDKIHRTLNDNLHILRDPALFVTLIKSLRHNREQDDDILSTIACTILFNKTYQVYSFMANCHILALFADYAYYDEGLLNLLTSASLKEIRTNKVQLIRNKDITRFLWSISALNFCENTACLKAIVPIIERKVQLGHYKNDIEELIEVILYLWMLNYQATDLIKYALTSENISYVKEQKSRTKLRLNLLISCVYFENRHLFKELNLSVEPFHPNHTKLHLERRPLLSKVLYILKRISPEISLNKFEITYEVPHLDICGITGYTDGVYKSVYVEVLDDTVCVKNRESWPIGPMLLKLRVLKTFDEALIMIDGDMAENSTEEELKDYLIQEIQLLC